MIRPKLWILWSTTEKRLSQSIILVVKDTDITNYLLCQPVKLPFFPFLKSWLEVSLAQNQREGGLAPLSCRDNIYVYYLEFVS